MDTRGGVLLLSGSGARDAQARRPSVKSASRSDCSGTVRRLLVVVQLLDSDLPRYVSIVGQGLESPVFSGVPDEVW
jgi:hypothetical protein